MYELRERHDEGSLVGVDVFCGESRAAGFTGGLTMTIAATHSAAQTLKEKQNFLHGLVLAMAHCSITGAIPVVVDR